MKNKIKSILSILFVGFALILSFSCNMGIIEIEQKEEVIEEAEEKRGLFSWFKRK